MWSRRTESHKTDHKTVVVKSVLFVRKVRLSPSVVLAHAKVLENATAKYPTRLVVCKMVAGIAT